jgi:hypothetical protein
MPLDELIDNVIACCDGNLRGAVMALLLVNERLETELEDYRRAEAHPAPALQPAIESVSYFSS